MASISFDGAATRRSDGAVAKAAKDLGCEEAAVRAVMDVESRGGFFANNRPKILFERHYFWRLTKGAHGKTDPDICAQAGGGYLGGPAEYGRLERACKLDEDAALESASWGAFQVMGAHWKSLGYKSVQEFVSLMCASEDNQLDAFVRFVRKNGLADELQRHDWAGFARGYNGPNFKAFSYDTKLAAAYTIHALGGARADSGNPVLKMGARGDDVVELQKLLGLKLADGDFGPASKAAVVAFQKKAKLTPDGIVGPSTWRALKAG